MLVHKRREAPTALTVLDTQMQQNTPGIASSSELRNVLLKAPDTLSRYQLQK